MNKGSLCPTLHTYNASFGKALHEGSNFFSCFLKTCENRS